ncbi:MAG: PIN domain-containing protein [Planctomycetaceae bacterium]|nr:PIN domain-containing protein [Planctomycetaceae bacterium]
MTILDTNTVLRCILQDNEEAAVLVDERMSRDVCVIPPEVVAEIVYVLLKIYRLDRSDIVRSVSTILRHQNVRVPHRKVVEAALHYFGKTKFDFVDCLMIGYAVIEGHQIFTFDNELKKYLSQSTPKT